MPNKFDVDPELVRKLADLLGETGLNEIEYESGGRRVRVARGTGGGLVATSAPAAPAGGAQPTAEPEPQRTGTAVTAPMVGTIFLAPEPGAAPFVQVGDSVSEGQTVMLIEAMKTYNPVRAPRSGKVTEILVGDSTPVEFGEELLILE
jgi:acetyl-CoA carboxylase biotin carboxyl carrier protein